MRQMKFPYKFERLASRYNQNKRKTVAPHINHLMCSLLLLFTFSIQVVGKANTLQLCLSWLLSYSYSFTKSMPETFQGSGESSFGGSEKDRYILKIPEWKHKLIQEHKQKRWFLIF